MPDPIRCVIADDEPPARRLLRRFLDERDDIVVAAEAGSGREAVDAIRLSSPDVVFLDVAMPELNGFEVLASLPAEEAPLVVFVTAYDEHAVRAFDANAADYLLKPFDDERFHRALDRARARVGDRRVRELASRLATLLAPAGAESPAPAPPPATAEETPSGGYSDRIVLKSSGRITFLEVASIDWIEAADYVVRLHAGGATHSLREPISDLERRLDPRRFFRIHRSTIVNLSSVREMQPLFHGEYAVILRDGTRLRLSRSRRNRLQALLGASF